jgi:hypothetical protein
LLFFRPARAAPRCKALPGATPATKKAIQAPLAYSPQANSTSPARLGLIYSIENFIGKELLCYNTTNNFPCQVKKSDISAAVMHH